MRGVLMLIVGPSGAGKDTLIDGARAALAGDARFRFVRRVITRPEDAGGEAHEAIDAAGFTERRAAGAFALNWHAHGLDYGIPADVMHDLDAGRVVVANVSREMLADAARRFPVHIVEIAAPTEILAQRLAARGREAPGDLRERLTRIVAVPKGIPLERIVNDGPPDVGIARFVAALSRVADTVRPG